MCHCDAHALDLAGSCGPLDLPPAHVAQRHICKQTLAWYHVANIRNSVPIFTTVYQYSPQLTNAHQSAHLICLTMRKLQMAGWVQCMDTNP